MRSISSLFFFLLFSIAIYCQSTEIRIPLVSQISERRVNSKLLQPAKPNYMGLAGIPADLDTFSYWFLELNTSQQYFEQLQAGEIQQEAFDKINFPEGSYLKKQFNHRVYALSGLRADQKVLIIDSNNNGDLSDEIHFEFDTSQTYLEKMEAATPLLLLQFEYAQDGVINQGQIFGKVEPFEFQGDSSYYKNDFFYLGFELYEWYTGILEIAGQKFNVRTEGSIVRPDLRSYTYIWPYGAPFEQAQRYSDGYDIFLNDHKIQIVGNDLVTHEMVFEDFGKVSEEEKIGGGVGMYAPQIQQKDINDQDFDLHKLRGEYVVMHFWAVWCGPCLAQHPRLVELHEQYQSKMKFVGVAADMKISMTRAHAKKAQLEWTNLYTPFQEVLNKDSLPSQYWVHEFPTYLILSPEGKILHRFTKMEELEETIGQLFGSE